MCRALTGNEERRAVPSAMGACESWTGVPGTRDRSRRSTLRVESSASQRRTTQDAQLLRTRPSEPTRRPQVFHRFQTPSPSPPRAGAPSLRVFQASISSSTSGRHARSDRGVAPTTPFQRARSAARSSPRATTSSGTPVSDQRPTSSRSRGPSASPRPRTTVKRTSTRSAKPEVGGRRLIPHLVGSNRPTEGQGRLTSPREVEDDAAATPKDFSTRSMACPPARSPTSLRGHRGPESKSTCDVSSSSS